MVDYNILLTKNKETKKITTLNLLKDIYESKTIFIFDKHDKNDIIFVTNYGIVGKKIKYIGEIYVDTSIEERLLDLYIKEKTKNNISLYKQELFKKIIPDVIYKYLTTSELNDLIGDNTYTKYELFDYFIFDKNIIYKSYTNIYDLFKHENVNAITFLLREHKDNLDSYSISIYDTQKGSVFVTDSIDKFFESLPSGVVLFKNILDIKDKEIETNPINIQDLILNEIEFLNNFYIKEFCNI